MDWDQQATQDKIKKMHDKLYETMRRLKQRARKENKEKKGDFTKYGQSYTFLHLCAFMESRIGQRNFNACIEVVHMFLYTIARLLTKCIALQSKLQSGPTMICSGLRASLDGCVRSGGLLSLFPAEDRGKRLCELFWSLNAIVRLAWSGKASLLEQWSVYLHQVIRLCDNNEPMAGEKVKKILDSLLEDNGLAEQTAGFPCPDKEAYLKVLCCMLEQCTWRSQLQHNQQLHLRTYFGVSHVFERLGVDRGLYSALAVRRRLWP